MKATTTEALGRINLPGYKCERCEHKWYPRKRRYEGEDPEICPACKSPYWNKSRKEKGKS